MGMSYMIYISFFARYWGVCIRYTNLYDSVEISRNWKKSIFLEKNFLKSVLGFDRDQDHLLGDEDGDEGKEQPSALPSRHLIGLRDLYLSYIKKKRSGCSALLVETRSVRDKTRSVRDKTRDGCVSVWVIWLSWPCLCLGQRPCVRVE